MSPIYDFSGETPTIGENVFIAPTAALIGMVSMADNTSAFYGAVLRGDAEKIEIGPGSNLQDNVVVHATPGYPLRLGSGVSVGHNATIHGCRVADDCLIGMGATILNGAQIGEGSLIAAGAVVLEGMQIPPRSLVAGVPAKVRRETTETELENIWHNATKYLELARGHRQLHKERAIVRA